MTVKHLNISPNQKVCVYVETIVINKYAGKYAINQAYEDKYGEILGWKDMSSEEMQKAWQNAKASDMLTICKDIECGDLPDLEMPKHIKDVLDFMKKTSVIVEGKWS